jgi:hypothetical protein
VRRKRAEIAGGAASHPLTRFRRPRLPHANAPPPLRAAGRSHAALTPRSALGLWPSGHMAAPGEYVVSPQRFQALALFCAIGFLWAGPWLVFAPLSDLAEARFDVGPAAINALASSFLFCYIPSSVLCLYVVDRFGVRVCLAVSITVDTAVVLVRWLALAAHGLSPHAQYAVNLTAQVCGTTHRLVSTRQRLAWASGCGTRRTTLRHASHDSGAQAAKHCAAQRNP